MGQVLGPDNIPPIVKASATTLTLATTYLGKTTRITVGGQQYVPAATITLSTATSGFNGIDTGSIAANTLYYVYAVVQGGVLGLVISVTGPATGPTGFTSSYRYVANFRTLSGSSSIADVNTILTGQDYKWLETNEGPTLPAAMTDSQATALGLKVYSHGGTYNGGLAPTITLNSGGGTLDSVQIGDFVPYQVQSGGWRMRFNVEVVLSSLTRTLAYLSVVGIVGPASTGTGQIIAAAPFNGVAAAAGYFEASGSRLLVNYPSGTTTNHGYSGDVKIASKPTWAY